MNLGVPPTELKARTGEFTPPGITAQASANSWADRWVCVSSTRMATSVPAHANPSTTGCSGQTASTHPRRDRALGHGGERHLDRKRSTGRYDLGGPHDGGQRQ